MIPPKDHPAWKPLVRGECTHTFKALSAAMCVSRVVRFVQKQGGTAEAVDLAIDDLYSFFVKLEDLLREDIEAIFGQRKDHAESSR
ncbi:MAG TPA: hypothetical protein VIU40_05950 [Geobacteraceae bacterium]